MKRLLLIWGTLLIVGSVLGAWVAFGADVSLVWDANTEPGVQYRIYASRYAQEYDFTTPLYEGAATSCTVVVDASAEYKFVARAFLIGSTGQVYESGNSNEVVHAVVIWTNPNLRVQ